MKIPRSLKRVPLKYLWLVLTLPVWFQNCGGFSSVRELEAASRVTSGTVTSEETATGATPAASTPADLPPTSGAGGPTPVTFESIIYLAKQFNSNASVYDAGGTALPKTFVNSGFTTGMAGKITTGSAAFPLSENALFIVPPGRKSDFSQVTFSRLNLNPSLIAWLHFKAGIIEYGPDHSAGY